MAKSLPGIVIKIGANTKDAIDGLNKVNRALGSSASNADRMRASWRKAGPALAAAAAGAGLLAIKIGKDAVAAAMEEEQSVGRLATTLKNLGLATEQAGVEQFVDNLQYATAIADQDLRPAMDRLVRSTGNVGEAQRALGIAADIAVAKQRSVVDVANILGKAYDGNTMALGRLGVGLDKSVLKSGSMAEITQQLSDLFGGQAAAAADTLAGRLSVLSMGMSELNEAFGQGLIAGFVGDAEDANTSLADMTTQLRNTQETAKMFGEAIGGAAKLALGAFDVVRGTVANVVYGIVQQMNTLYEAYINIADKLGRISDEEADRERQRQVAIRAAQKQAYYEDLLGYQFGQSADAASSAADSTRQYARGIEDTTTQAGKAKTALQRLQQQMDRMSKNRSIAGQRLSLAQTRREGPGKGQNLREFGLGYADQAAQLAQDIAERGGFSEKSKAQARRILGNARQYLAGIGLGDNFTDRNGAFLGTPGALRAGTTNSRLANRVGDYEGRKSGIYIDKVIVQADSPAEAIEKAKRWARQKALGRTMGPVPAGALLP